MSFYNFLRNIFGFPKKIDEEDPFKSENYNYSTRDNYGHTWMDDHDDEDFDTELMGPPDVQPFGFKIFSSPLEIHRFFEKQMDEMLKTFHMFESDPMIGIGDFHSLEPPDGDGGGGNGDGKSLRDELFKPGYQYKYPGTKGYLEGKKEDNDLDESIKSSNLGEILDGKPSLHNHDSELQVPRLHTKVFGKCFTNKTIRRPDGSVEHHKVVKDNQGNEETTVTRQIGDKKYIVVTQTDPSGLVKKSETFQNVEEGEIEEFKKKWNLGQMGEYKRKDDIDFRKFFNF